MCINDSTVGRLLFEGYKFRGFLFCGFNFRKFMPSAILYHIDLIFAVIFANFLKIAKFAKFIALKKAPYGNFEGRSFGEF